MGQLREKIRQMVRNEFAARILQEAEKDDKYSGKTVYRSSKYIDIWNDMPMGKSTKEITPNPTKHDFVRYVMSMLQTADKENISTRIYLEPKHQKIALSLLRPLANDPDEFVEKMNQERGIVFGQAYDYGPDFRGSKLRDQSSDPVTFLLTKYKSHKEPLGLLTTKVADEPPVSIKADTEGEYDIIPGTTSKADIARMLSQDPTETTTEMSVLNRLKNAIKHLMGTPENKKEMTVKIFAFLQDPTIDKNDKLEGIKEIMAEVDKLDVLINRAAERYSEMFVDAYVQAAKKIKNLDDFEQLEEARSNGYENFVAALRAAGTFSPAVNRDTINPVENAVFDAALDQEVGNTDVFNMIVVAAKRPDRAELFRDEAIASVKDTFLDEMKKQTNFNTLGDFTSMQPEIKKVRQEVFDTIEKRGRKPGSTKEFLAAHKAAAAEED